MVPTHFGRPHPSIKSNQGTQIWVTFPYSLSPPCQSADCRSPRSAGERGAASGAEPGPEWRWWWWWWLWLWWWPNGLGGFRRRLHSTAEVCLPYCLLTWLLSTHLSAVILIWYAVNNMCVYVCVVVAGRCPWVLLRRHPECRASRWAFRLPGWEYGHNSTR